MLRGQSKKVIFLSNSNAEKSTAAQALLSQLSILWKFDLSSAPPDIPSQSDIVFSISASGSSPVNIFFIQDPIWQLGTVDQPKLLSTLEHEIFFKHGEGHFGFNGLAALRVDDYPLTSERFLKTNGKVSDRRIKREIEEIIAACRGKALPEFMVTSHVLLPSGKLIRVSEIVPESINLLKYLYSQGIININAHGRSHVDEAVFLQTGRVLPEEFFNLTDEETVSHLEESIKFIRETFGKKPTGFVPPCWSYNLSNTKKLASRYFQYLADSNQRLERGEAEPFGSRMNSGTVHMPETIRATSPKLNLTATELWETYVKTGIPLHFVVHGPYLTEPLAWISKLINSHYKLSAFSVIIVLSGVLLLFDALLLRISLAVIFCAGIGMWFNRHLLADMLRRYIVRLPSQKRKSLKEVMRVASGCGVRWVSLEDLAAIACAYGNLELISAVIQGNYAQVRFIAHVPVPAGIAYFSPSKVIAAEIDTQQLLNFIDNKIDLGGISAGEHILIYTTE